MCVNHKIMLDNDIKAHYNVIRSQKREEDINEGREKEANGKIS